MLVLFLHLCDLSLIETQCLMVEALLIEDLEVAALARCSFL